MKTNYTVFKIVALTLLFTCNSWGQTTIAQWNFNGANDTSVPGGSTSPLPVTGSGTVGMVGGVSASAAFGTGLGNTANPTPSSDPVVTTPNTNFAWAITNYPALGTGNKQNGIQVNVSTVGYADITFRFDQRLSNKAGNTYVVQYTTDRTVASPVWVDAQTFTFTPAETGTGDLWYNLRTVDLSAVTALDNNANAAFRVVAAFDPTTGDYLASRSTSTYDGTGNTRFDMVTVSAATTLAINTFAQNQNKFVITPNPVRNNVIYFKETTSMTIYDVTGKNVLQANDVKELNVSSLNSGVYLVKNNEGYVIKLVKE